MKTIYIERKTIDYTVKRKQHGAFRDTYMRGKQPSKNNIEKETIEVVLRHIRSFTKMESHYSRKKRKKNNTLLTIWISNICGACMSRNVDSKTWCMLSKHNTVRCFVTVITIPSSNIKKINVPCVNATTGLRKQVMTTEIYKRIMMIINQWKFRRRKRKKKTGRNNRKMPSTTFDLQAVHTTPCTLVSEMYYSRNLCCYI